MPADSIAVYVEPESPIGPEIRYTIDLFLSTLGAPHRFVMGLDEAASYGATMAYVSEPASCPTQGSGQVLIHASHMAGQFLTGDKPYPSRVSDHILYRDRQLPLLFSDEPLGDVDASLWIGQARTAGHLPVPADILATAFWFLSRWEEAKSTLRDPWGRFRYQDSLYAGERTCSMTVVDGYLALLSDLLQGVNETGGRRLWWTSKWKEDAPFALCVTHDIDSLRKWHPRRILGEAGYVRQAWRTSGPRGALDRVSRAARAVWQNPNPHGNVLELAQEERDRGLRCTYFFLAGRNHRLDAAYDLTRQRGVAELVRQVQGLGHEIGLHGSFLTYGDSARLEGEREMLERVGAVVVGQRQHFLRFDTQVSWPDYEAVGFEYDASLGFAEQEGSRSGVSFPFFPYDLERRQSFSFIEIPLTVMDATLHNYRQLDAGEAWASVEKMLKDVAATGGCLTLLWHNASFDELDMPGYGSLFWRVVAWAEDRGAWIAPLAEVSRWWVDRSLASGGQWSLPASSSRRGC